MVVEVEGTGRARSSHATKAEAERAGREVARMNMSELLIHRRDGKITARNTYGNDPGRGEGEESARGAKRHRDRL
jgi:ketosteroid isomerase-like protein